MSKDENGNDLDAEGENDGRVITVARNITTCVRD